MEAAGAAASAMTLLGAAVNGTKALVQAISAIKNASRTTETLVSAVQALQIVLEQLQASIEVARNDIDVGKTEELVTLCNKDIARYKTELQKLQSKPGDDIMKRGFKKFRTVFLGEKDFARVLAEVNNHCTVLQFQLNHLTSKDTLIIKENVVEINAAATTHMEHDENQTLLLQQSSAELSSVNKKMNILTNGVSNNVRESLAVMTEHMKSISQVSQAQSGDILTLLNALYTQIAGLPNEMTVTQRISASPHTVMMGILGEVPENKQEDLSESIGRLRSLKSQKAGTLRDEEAESITTDLVSLLESASESTTGELQATSSKRKFHGTAEDEISARELKRLCAQLTSSYDVNVNTGGKYDPELASVKNLLIQLCSIAIQCAT
ncbi:hypothetical protein BDV95DRAFT_91558 [Massariosphaeria phaeospora]|uniref:Azaphilone pigments biosynthesis cluster protein L N-terminal domain-containing protein n=1 Tax=Massariosphaeria phaeospora TaxID=100035 RepID=A0A7C8M9U3_9PLEO|nr:hypothetical protein BDV95DRAFT_91558 [Massariosphaeria phaeospora]